MVAKTSQYEVERDQRIATNRAKLLELEIKPLTNKRPARSRTGTAGKKRQRLFVNEPVRRSTRARGMAAPAPEAMVELPDEFEAIPQRRLHRPSRKPRLTSAQSQQLEKLADGTKPTLLGRSLTAKEAAACEAALEALKGSSVGRTAAIKMGNAEYYSNARDVLKQQKGIRLPGWLSQLEDLVLGGKSIANRNQTMFSLEKACCGIGLRHRSWPDTVGLLVGHGLTLGADTEALKREGQKLEAVHGDDVSNGWAYNHAMGKLRLFQIHLLRTAADDWDCADDDLFQNTQSIADEEEAAEDKETTEEQ